jgi:hypothetical protein
MIKFLYKKMMNVFKIVMELMDNVYLEMVNLLNVNADKITMILIVYIKLMILDYQMKEK